MNEDNGIILKGKTKMVSPSVYEAFGETTATIHSKYSTTIFNLNYPRKKTMYYVILEVRQH